MGEIPLVSIKNHDMDKSMNLNRFIATSGLCSRREADVLIEEGRVSVNGKRAEHGYRVQPSDNVSIDGEPVKIKFKPTVIAFYKPVGITSTTNLGEKTNVISFIDHPEHIFPIGKLDKDASGLLILTNRSDLAKRMKKLSNRYQKELLIQLNKPVNKDMLRAISKGVKLKKSFSKPCKTYPASKHTFGIVTTEDQSKIIPAIVRHFGYRISAIYCERIENIKIGKMKPGRWRNLTDHEINTLEERLGQR